MNKCPGQRCLLSNANEAVVDFFNHVNMLYGTVSEFCTPTECHIMNAGPKYEFYWEDGDVYRKPTPLSAPAYVEALMTWTQSLLDDEKIFPQRIGVKFPSNFMTTAKTILRRLFRVYAHIYHSHFDQICGLGIEGKSQSTTKRGPAQTNGHSAPQHELPPLLPLRGRVLSS